MTFWWSPYELGKPSLKSSQRRLFHRAGPDELSGVHDRQPHLDVRGHPRRAGGPTMHLSGSDPELNFAVVRPPIRDITPLTSQPNYPSAPCSLSATTSPKIS